MQLSKLRRWKSSWHFDGPGHSLVIQLPLRAGKRTSRIGASRGRYDQGEMKIRHLPILLTAVLASVGLLAVSGQANAAMPTLSIDRSAVADQGREGRLLLPPPLGLLSVLLRLQALLPALLPAIWLLRLLRPTLSLPLLASGAATGRDRRSETSPVPTLSCASPV